MNLVKGEALVFPKPGKSFDPEQIPRAIKDAGFTTTEVDVVAEGTLVKREGALELDIAGLKHGFTLAGGPQAAALAKRADLVGKKIRITGKLGATHGHPLPELTIESFQPAT